MCTSITLQDGGVLPAQCRTVCRDGSDCAASDTCMPTGDPNFGICCPMANCPLSA
jgi:hypothetical protein